MSLEKISVSDARKQFKYEENEDGTLIINGIKDSFTDYDSNEFYFPAKIGNKKVSAIDQFVLPYGFDCTKIIISDGITDIKLEAFSGAKRVTDIVIPNSVTNIEHFAFYSCAFKTIALPPHLTYIDEFVFCDCKNLENIVVPDSITTIKRGAFKNCSNLKSIVFPNNNIHIEDNAFKGCRGLADKDGFVIVNGILFDYVGDANSVSIPENVYRISEDAFEECSSITNIAISPNTFEIGANAFIGCSGLADKDGYVIVNGILFDYVGKETTITIPESINQIGKGAFGEHQGLEKVIVGNNVTKINAGAFYGCKNLKSIILGDNVASISYMTFNNCENLRQLVFNNQKMAFDDYCFEGCRSLADKDGFIIFNNVLLKYFGNEKTVIVPSDITAINGNAFCYCNNIQKIVLPDRLKRIGSFAFQSCEKLKKIELPESVNEVDKEAFYGYEGFVIYYGNSSFAHLKSCYSFDKIAIYAPSTPFCGTNSHIDKALMRGFLKAMENNLKCPADIYDKYISFIEQHPKDFYGFSYKNPTLMKFLTERSLIPDEDYRFFYSKMSQQVEDIFQSYLIKRDAEKRIIEREKRKEKEKLHEINLQNAIQNGEQIYTLARCYKYFYLVDLSKTPDLKAGDKVLVPTDGTPQSWDVSEIYKYTKDEYQDMLSSLKMDSLKTILDLDREYYEKKRIEAERKAQRHIINIQKAIDNGEHIYTIAKVKITGFSADSPMYHCIVDTIKTPNIKVGDEVQVQTQNNQHSAKVCEIGQYTISEYNALLRRFGIDSLYNIIG